MSILITLLQDNWSWSSPCWSWQGYQPWSGGVGVQEPGCTGILDSQSPESDHPTILSWSIMVSICSSSYLSLYHSGLVDSYGVCFRDRILSDGAASPLIPLCNVSYLHSEGQLIVWNTILNFGDCHFDQPSAISHQRHGSPYGVLI